jgi:outer membrane cobalamin receptor
MVAGTWFEQRFKDLIQYAFQGPNMPNYFNVAEASARGLELEVGARVHPSVNISAASTLLRTNVENPGFASGAGATFVHGHRLLRRPSHSTTVTLSAQPSSRTTFDVVTRVVGNRDDRDFADFPAKPVVLPHYTRVDLRLTRELYHSQDGLGLRLLAGLENLFGARYQEIAGFASPGRVASLGFRLALRP